MTTIAYHHKNKTISIDSRMSCEGYIESDNADKTLKNDYGYWFFSGSVMDCERLAALKEFDHM